MSLEDFVKKQSERLPDISSCPEDTIELIVYGIENNGNERPERASVNYLVFKKSEDKTEWVYVGLRD